MWCWTRAFCVRVDEAVLHIGHAVLAFALQVLHAALECVEVLGFGAAGELAEAGCEATDRDRAHDVGAAEVARREHVVVREDHAERRICVGVAVFVGVLALRRIEQPLAEWLVNDVRVLVAGIGGRLGIGVGLCLVARAARVCVCRICGFRCISRIGNVCGILGIGGVSGVGRIGCRTRGIRCGRLSIARIGSHVIAFEVSRTVVLVCGIAVASRRCVSSIACVCIALRALRR